MKDLPFSEKIKITKHQAKRKEAKEAKRKRKVEILDGQALLLPGVTKKPWGHERILETTPTYTIKQIYVKNAQRLSEQYHKYKTETMMLVGGVGYLQVGKETLLMERLVPYYIPPKTIHRLTADAFDDCLVIEVSSSELDDVVRLEDDYDR
jgi:mannose-6-phosphate isomerase-like protein (cupin superfamily)